MYVIPHHPCLYLGATAESDPDPNSGFEFFSILGTAKDLEHSVDRWMSDPIPEDVVLFSGTKSPFGNG